MTQETKEQTIERLSGKIGDLFDVGEITYVAAIEEAYSAGERAGRISGMQDCKDLCIRFSWDDATGILSRIRQLISKEEL